MTVALVYPPTCDPTAPYVSVPLLAGWLRAHGVEVLTVDANLAACEHLLRPSSLALLRGRAEERYRALNGKGRPTHAEAGRYLALLDGLAGSGGVEAAVEGALETLRGERPGFTDHERYEEAVVVIGRALGLVSAAYAPLELSFAAYRSPFSLLTAAERVADAAPERNPYHDYFARELVPALLERGVSLIGISMVFPGQIQPSYSLAHALRAAPGGRGVHLVVGGPAMTQILAPLGAEARAQALDPFDTAVMYEGELALLHLVRELEAGRRPRGIVVGKRMEDLGALPAPDWSDAPLDRYLSPEPVLPYDFTRGCPWGRCAFCHYGLADAGTAPYRERPLDRVLEHLEQMRRRHGSRLVYLSEDSVRPARLRELAGELRRAGSPLRWSTDVRPERLLGDRGVAEELREGGALSFSFGVESGSARLLRLMRKGTDPDAIRSAIRATAEAGIAAEAMVFTGFPTETGEEALETLRLLEELAGSVSLFMCGTFGLTSGSAVAREPERFDINEVWRVAGDDLGLALQYTPRRSWKSARDEAAVESALEALSRRWRLASYPWAGSLSTAHTMLWYEAMGPDVFRRLARRRRPRDAAPRAALPEGPRHDVERLGERFSRDEAAIWRQMVQGERAVSRARYEELAARAGLSSSGGSSTPASGRRRGDGGPGSRRRARPRRRGAEGR